MKDLKITVVQSELAWENPKTNLAHFSRLCQKVKRGSTHLIVLPEMFTTGFSMNAEKLSDTMRGETVTWMRDLAVLKNTAVCGSVIIKERGRYYNRLVWMGNNGKLQKYDKRHLFTMAREERTYTAGNKKLMVTLNGWRICPLVCYDLRFPVWSRQHPADPYDLLIFVANWPRRRSVAWRQLLIARAIENQCYVAGINRIGKDGNGVGYAGDSAVIDPTGFAISKSDPRKAFVETVTLSRKNLQTIRRYMPFLKDADRFSIRP